MKSNLSSPSLLRCKAKFLWLLSRNRLKFWVIHLFQVNFEMVKRKLEHSEKYLGGPRQVIVQSVIPQSQVMLLHPAPGSSIQTIAPLQSQQPKLISQTVSQSPVVSTMNGQGQSNGVRLASPRYTRIPILG